MVAQLSYNSSLSRDPLPDNKYLSWFPNKKKTNKKKSVFYFTYVCVKKQKLSQTWSTVWDQMLPYLPEEEPSISDTTYIFYA